MTADAAVFELDSLEFDDDTAAYLQLENTGPVELRTDYGMEEDNDS